MAVAEAVEEEEAEGKDRSGLSQDEGHPLDLAFLCGRSTSSSRRISLPSSGSCTKHVDGEGVGAWTFQQLISISPTD
jgi:hypothetical protein